MGGRGASFGKSAKGKVYGTEYRNAFENGETFMNGRLKFVRQIDDRPRGNKPMKPQSVKTPMETMTKGRVYATVNAENKLSAVTFYKQGERVAQIDLNHPHKNMGAPHTHKGYEHGEKGTRKSNAQERKLVATIEKIWYNRQ